ncbi:MAG TPA: hypothetical protein VGL87_09205, partial [Steroidobacteraceae bacterium]
YWHHTPEVDVEYRINAEGLRADRNYPFVKPPGTCRLGMFGDSFLFGLEVDLQHSFAARLEQRLRERGIPVDVLNFSVGGFGTAEMLQTYEQFGRKFDLDAVLFSWDLSDVNDNLRSGLYTLKSGQLHRLHAAYLPAVNIQDWLMRYRLYRLVADHSHLYTFVRDRINLLVKSGLAKMHRQSLASEDAGENEGGARSGEEDVDAIRHRDALELSAAILERARAVVVSNGQDFYVIDIPVRLSRTKFASTVGTLPISANPPLTIISPVTALSRAARPELKLYYEKGLGHFTPTGIDILVDEAVRDLAASPKLTSCAADAARAGNPAISTAAAGAARTTHPAISTAAADAAVIGAAANGALQPR